MFVCNVLVASAGLAVGAVIGGLGAQRAKRSSLPARSLDARAFNERLKQIEQKLRRASRIKRRLSDEAVNERIDKVAQKVREMARHSRTPG